MKHKGIKDKWRKQPFKMSKKTSIKCCYSLYIWSIVIKKYIQMDSQNIMVVYSWTAKTGKSENLKAIYADVERSMNETEPGALNVQCYFDESNGKLIVMDLFQDAGALGQHLGTTAAAHFPSLLEIAVPGPFLFCGDIPAEMRQAALGMGLDATFAPHVFGFVR